MGKAVDKLRPLVDLDSLRKLNPKLFKDMVEDEYRSLSFSPSDVEGRNVLDIGAHVGMFSMLCWAHGAKSITAIEPSPINYGQLVKNVTPLGVVTLNAAAHNGLRDFVSVRENGHSTTVSPTTTGIRSLSLDDLVCLLPPGNEMALKVDTEGSEYEIMLSATARTIRRFHTIFLECHPQMAVPTPPYSPSFLLDYMSFHNFGMVKEDNMFWWKWAPDGKLSCTRIEGLSNYKLVRRI